MKAILILGAAVLALNVFAVMLGGAWRRRK